MSSYKKSPPPSCMECPHRTSRMFCNLSPNALVEFDRMGSPMRLSRGVTLFQEDDPCAGVSVVCSGQLKLSCTSNEGKTMILKIAMPGDVLGLSATISGNAYEVTAEAMEPTVVKSIRRDEFMGFVERYGQASMNTAKAISEEYKAAFFDARRLALAPSAAGRLASVFLEWAKMASCGKSELRFTMALTHDELASLAGTSRETITRSLGKFQKDNWIQMHGSSVLILAPEQLAQIAS